MIKKLSESIREYKKYAILTPLLILLEVALEVVIPLQMSWMIDYGIDAGNMAYTVKMGLLLVLAAGFSLLFGVLGGQFAVIGSSGFAKNLRKDMFYAAQNFSFSNIDNFSPASIVTRLTTDVTNVQQSYQMLTRMAIRAPIMILLSLIAIVRINAKMSLIFLGVIPILGFGLYFIIRLVYPIFQRVFKTYDKLNNVVSENLRGVRVVKSFVREDYEQRKFEKISSDIFNDFSIAEKTMAFNMPLMQTSMYVCMLLISWFGARLIVASGNNPAVGLTTGKLMSLMSFIMQILMNLMMISMVLVMITISRASAERIVELLNEKSDLTNKPDPIIEVPNGEIIFEHVNFNYGKNTEKNVLSDIHLTIRSGETIGILGGTGSAKSSLVQLIPRLYDVTGGSVKVGGNDVRDYDIETLRNAVAVVLQKNTLFSGTIKDNLRWGNENATDAEMIQACQLAQADGFIQAFPNGYDTWIEQGGTNVSGGQKQRLCIARALLKKPKVLILDDSTSAVDTRTDAKIRQALFQTLPGVTKLIIAQRVASVMDADRIIVIEEGKITEMGSHEELLQRSAVYREVYESQTKGGRDNE